MNFTDFDVLRQRNPRIPAEIPMNRRIIQRNLLIHSSRKIQIREIGGQHSAGKTLPARQAAIENPKIRGLGSAREAKSGRARILLAESCARKMRDPKPWLLRILKAKL